MRPQNEYDGATGERKSNPTVTQRPWCWLDRRTLSEYLDGVSPCGRASCSHDTADVESAPNTCLDPGCLRESLPES